MTIASPGNRVNASPRLHHSGRIALAPHLILAPSYLLSVAIHAPSHTKRSIQVEMARCTLTRAWRKVLSRVACSLSLATVALYRRTLQPQPPSSLSPSPSPFPPPSHTLSCAHHPPPPRETSRFSAVPQQPSAGGAARATVASMILTDGSLNPCSSLPQLNRCGRGFLTVLHSACS